MIFQLILLRANPLLSPERNGFGLESIRDRRLFRANGAFDTRSHPTVHSGLREGRVTQGKFVLESIITEIDVEISRFQRVRTLLANEGPKRSRPAKNLSCCRQRGSVHKTTDPEARERMRQNQLSRRIEPPLQVRIKLRADDTRGTPPPPPPLRDVTPPP